MSASIDRERKIPLSGGKVQTNELEQLAGYSRSFKKKTGVSYQDYCLQYQFQEVLTITSTYSYIGVLSRIAIEPRLLDYLRIVCERY